MIHEHESEVEQLMPAYAGRLDHAPIPKNAVPEFESPPDAVYRLIHDELLLDGSSRLNMATFVTTWMDPQAERLMAETSSWRVHSRGGRCAAGCGACVSTTPSGRSPH